MARGRRVALLCCGSRGDVQPFAALALHLQSTGFVVKLGTNNEHLEFVRSLGIDAVGISEDNGRILADPEVQQSWPRPHKIAEKYFGDQARIEVELVRDFRPDMILAEYQDGSWRRVLSHIFDVPVIFAPYHPQLASRYQISSAGEPDWMPGRVRAILGIGTRFLTWLGPTEKRLEAAIAATKLPGIELYKAGFLQNLYDSMYPLIRPICCAIPTFFEVDLPDLEESQKPIYTGTWIIEAAQVPRGNKFFGGGENVALEQFLAAGDAPVYIGWGFSGGTPPHTMARLAVGVLRQLDVRGVIIGGHAQLSQEHLEGDPGLLAYAEKRVLFVKTAAHETLFPRCSVIVHHGGIGTVAAVLRAGKPQVITPFFVEQHLNGRDVVRAGVGRMRGYFKKYTVENLSQDVHACLTDATMAENCAKMGVRARAEAGVHKAADLINQVFQEQIDTGRWREAHERRKALLTQPKAKRHPSCFVWLAKACCSPWPVAFRSWVE